MKHHSIPNQEPGKGENQKSPASFQKPDFSFYIEFYIYASSATTSKGISTETSLCSLTIAL